jgi:hypothetical protein
VFSREKYQFYIFLFSLSLSLRCAVWEKLSGTEERTEGRTFSYDIYGFSYQKPAKELPRLSITSYIYGNTRNVGMESPQGKVWASLSFCGGNMKNMMMMMEEKEELFCRE